jgi:hypothetical protein
MKKYVFTGVVCLSLVIVSCAQQAEKVMQPAAEIPHVEADTVASQQNRLLPSAHPAANFSMFFVEPTTYQSKLNAVEWFGEPVQRPDLGTLAVKGELPHMIAFGGGMTAGVSNGGLNREAQQFAYPNLVAHQMGITDFKTPLFNESEANGTGIFLYDDPKAEYPRWREVSNNLAKLEAGAPVKLTPYEGQVHNFAFPGGSINDISSSNCIKCPYQPYLQRLASYRDVPDSSFLSVVKRRQNYDFVILEDFLDGFLDFIIHAERIDERFYGPSLNENRIPSYGMERVLSRGQKGVVFTIPHLKDMGFINWYDAELLKKKVSSLQLVYWIRQSASVTDGIKSFYLKPTPLVEGTFRTAESGKPLEAKLLDSDIIDNGEYWFINPDMIYNPNIHKFAKEQNLALVDLRDIFERIHQGEYVTDDGYQIDGSRTGNFFSSDGIYPTPVGQAVIANEVIKAINAKYGAKIPLIHVGDFVRAIEFK